MDRSIAPQLNGAARQAVQVALAVVCAVLAACGDPSCPGGSISVNGRCEPALACREGEVQVDGACVDESGLTPDSGADANVDGDGDGSVLPTNDAGDSDAAVPGDDAEVMLPPDPLCEGFDCGDHGGCEVNRGEPRCACDEGYAGAVCDVCEAGLVPQDDECVAACEADDAPDCGDQGECRVSGGVAECACEHPAAGDTCEECAEGFAQQSDGSCEPDCGECGGHAFCNEELMTPSCECVAGYGETAGGCVWTGDGATGGIVDGDLEQAGAWTIDRMTFAGGVASFANVEVNGVCRLGSIEQTIHMPTRAESEQLVLEIEARATCASTDPESCPALLVDIADSLTRLTMAGGPTPVMGSTKTCLGEKGYGGDVLVRVRPALSGRRGVGRLSCGDPWPALHSISIRSALPGECPTVGQALGSLSGTTGWSLSGGATLAGNKLSVASNNAVATTAVAVPAAGGLAVKFTTSSPPNTGMLIDGMLWQYGQPSVTGSVCLPSWSFGGVHQIGFSGVIGGAEITNLSFAPDSACTTGELDARFDRPIGSGAWSPFGSNVTITNYTGTPPRDRAWRVQSTEPTPTLNGLLLFPGYRDETVRPAVAAWLRLGGNNMQGKLRLNGASIVNRDLTATLGGATSVVCVGAEWAGQPAALFQAVPSVGAITGTSTATLWIDDLGPTTIAAEDCD